MERLDARGRWAREQALASCAKQGSQGVLSHRGPRNIAPSVHSGECTCGWYTRWPHHQCHWHPARVPWERAPWALPARATSINTDFGVHEQHLRLRWLWLPKLAVDWSSPRSVCTERPIVEKAKRSFGGERALTDAPALWRLRSCASRCWRTLGYFDTTSGTTSGCARPTLAGWRSQQGSPQRMLLLDIARYRQEHLRDQGEIPSSGS